MAGSSSYDRQVMAGATVVKIPESWIGMKFLRSEKSFFAKRPVGRPSFGICLLRIRICRGRYGTSVRLSIPGYGP